MPLAEPASPRKMLPPPTTIPDFDTVLMDGLDLAREHLGDRRVDAVAVAAHERLTGKLEQDALIAIL